ncbi:hypothetical protein [Pseudomonas syringae]|uniref:hypothetical protein n=1 Tax=Pseudomonas syringae TaxID=317 RepID=UPI00126930F0|nr:hypothetical protein [Pseudomonas syringae]
MRSLPETFFGVARHFPLILPPLFSARGIVIMWVIKQQTCTKCLKMKKFCEKSESASYSVFNALFYKKFIPFLQPCWRSIPFRGLKVVFQKRYRRRLLVGKKWTVGVALATSVCGFGALLAENA